MQPLGRVLMQSTHVAGWGAAGVLRRYSCVWTTCTRIRANDKHHVGVQHVPFHAQHLRGLVRPVAHQATHF